MARTASQLVAVVSERARDPQNLATSKPLTRTFVSEAQRFVNAHVGHVNDYVRFTTEPMCIVYNIEDHFPTLLRVNSVRINGREVPEIPFAQLSNLSKRWFRETGERFEVFARLGRTHLVLYPAVDAAVDLFVTGTMMTADLTDDADSTVVQDTVLSDVLDLAETLVYLRRRLYESAAVSIKRLLQRTFPEALSEQNRNTQPR